MSFPRVHPVRPCRITNISRGNPKSSSSGPTLVLSLKSAVLPNETQLPLLTSLYRWQ